MGWNNDCTKRKWNEFLIKWFCNCVELIKKKTWVTPADPSAPTWMRICSRPASSTETSSPSCCPRVPVHAGDLSRSLHPWDGDLWWAALRPSARTRTRCSAAGLRLVCKRSPPPQSSTSSAALRNRPVCNKVSLFLSCTLFDLDRDTKKEMWSKQVGSFLCWFLTMRQTYTEIHAEYVVLCTSRFKYVCFRNQSPV